MDIIHNPSQPPSGCAIWIFPSLFTDYIFNMFHQVSAPYLQVLPGQSLSCSLCFSSIKLILSHAHLMPVFGSMSWFTLFPLSLMLFPISSHKGGCTSFMRQRDCYLLGEIFLDPFSYTELGALPWSSHYTCNRARSWFIWHF